MHDISRRAVIGAFASLAMLSPLTLPAAERRVALKGYDPVAYFTKGRPEKGSPEFSAAYDDATYWFMNGEHRALFAADSERYAPQFNGLCAVTVSRGARYEADPEAWAIADGKLWVFGSKNGEALFRQHSGDIIAKATENWPQLRRGP